MSMTDLHISPAGEFNSSLIPPGLVGISKSNLKIDLGHFGFEHCMWIVELRAAVKLN